MESARLVRVGLAVMVALSWPGGVHAGATGMVPSRAGVEPVGRSSSSADEPATGRLPSSRRNVELLAALRPPGRDGRRFGDVAVFGGWAYVVALPTGRCRGSGVHVIDVQQPDRPRERRLLRARPGSSVSEGVQVVRVDTARFRGDLLVHNNEVCAPDGRGGVSIWDVTDPKEAKLLVANAGDTTGPNRQAARPHRTHSAFAWAAGSRAYMVSVDEEDDRPVDIFDITDPRRPRLVAETGLSDWPQANRAPLPPGGNASFHDVVVADVQGRKRMLLSYWDAGHIQIDVEDPARPVYLGDTDYEYPDPAAPHRGLPAEGNAHYGEFTADRDWFIGADEDLSPYRVVVESPGESFAALQADGPRQLGPGEGLRGAGTVFVGSACAGEQLPPADGPGVRWAVVEGGDCALDAKAAAVAAAGYQAAVVFNGADARPCEELSGGSVQAPIPVFLVGRTTGLAVLGAGSGGRRCPRQGSGPASPAVGTEGRRLGARRLFDGWGAVHLYRNQLADGRYPRVATFALPEAQDEALADGAGALTAHEVATDPARALAYVSHSAGGLRVLRFGEGRLEEVGHYADGNNLWGVEVGRRSGETIIFASDRKLGLLLFRYTGPA